jgi:hypothetical protein
MRMAAFNPAVFSPKPLIPEMFYLSKMQFALRDPLTQLTLGTPLPMRSRLIV